MDLRQAAEFFKTRWQWRKEAASYREEQLSKTERRKALVAKNKAETKAAKEATKKDEEEKLAAEKVAKKASERGEAPPAVDKPQAKEESKEEPKEKEAAKKKAAQIDKSTRRQAEQQKIIVDYLQTTITVLETTLKSVPVNSKQAEKLSANISQALKLIKNKRIEPEDLLEFGKSIDSLKEDVPEVAKNIDSVKDKWSDKQRSYWDLIQKEIENLKLQEENGEKLEFSKTLADDTLSIFEVFLGPAGPLFHVTRGLYDEYKESAKDLLGKVGKVTTWAGSKLPRLKKIWARKNSLFKRLFPKLSLALEKFGNKLKNLGSSLLGKLGLKGKFGKILNVASGVGSFLSTDIGKAVGVAGMAGAAVAIKKGSAIVPAVSNKIDELTDEVTERAGKLGEGLANLNSHFTNWLEGSWRTMTSFIYNQAEDINNKIGKAKLNLYMFKDVADEAQDKFFATITNWFTGIVNKLKALLPKSIVSAGEKAGKFISGKASAIKSFVDDKLGGDGSSKTNRLNIAAKGPATDGKDSIKVQGGVNLSGMDKGLMQNFYSMADEYHKLTGKTVQINSAKRSTEEQAKLKALYPGKAASPGYSMHEYGLALDINSGDATAMENLGLFSKFGFVRPVQNEAWHVEPIAIQGMKSAIRRGAVTLENAVETASTQSTGASSVQQAKNETEGRKKDNVAEKTEGTAKALSEPTKAASAVATATNSSSITNLTSKKASTAKQETNVSSVSSSAINTKASVSQTPEVSIAQASVAPRVETSYPRIESRSKNLSRTVDNKQEPENTKQEKNSTQVASNNIPLYLGDMGMLTLNLGIGA